MSRESIEFDVVVVGAGPAGLAAAIRLKQLNPELSVVVLEKGSEVGAHILSGAVVDPSGLDRLLPDWRDDESHPLLTAVKEDRFRWLGTTWSCPIPNFIMPPLMNNHGNYIVSLGLVCRWLGTIAEGLGVEIYPGFAAKEIVFNDKDEVVGVATGDMGILRDGTLDEGAEPAKFGIGIKELWEVPPEQHQPGLVQHTLGWPLDSSTGGGSFMYHLENNQVALGFIVHLNYKNPYLSPFDELQRYKTHPAIRTTLEGGTRLSYGARAISEGGLQSIPKTVFPGGALLGCSAGMLNVPRIKGSHNAVLSGIEAAESVHKAITAGRSHDELTDYETTWREGDIGKDLTLVRNVKPLLSRFGTLFGTLVGGFDMWVNQITRGWSLFGTLKHGKADHEALEPAAKHQPIDYPKPDGKLSFDKTSSVFLSNTNHEEDQPIHLMVDNMEVQITSEFGEFAGPSARYCPAGVYEWIDAQGNAIPPAESHTPQEGVRFQINAQNCVHCKTCDIKDPRCSLVRQAQHPLRNNIALHFVAAAIDRCRPVVQPPANRLALGVAEVLFINPVARAATHGEQQIVILLLQFTAVNLENRRYWSWCTAIRFFDCPALGQPEHLVVHLVVEHIAAQLRIRNLAVDFTKQTLGFFDQASLFARCTARHQRFHKAEHPVGVVGARRPDFLAVNHKMIAIVISTGAQARKVTARAGFTVPLAPLHLRSGDLWQVTLFLILRPHVKQGRTNHGGTKAR